jgi:hypothetical protein
MQSDVEKPILAPAGTYRTSSYALSNYGHGHESGKTQLMQATPYPARSFRLLLLA